MGMSKWRRSYFFREEKIDCQKVTLAVTQETGKNVRAQASTYHVGLTLQMARFFGGTSESRQVHLMICFGNERVAPQGGFPSPETHQRTG